MSWGFSSVLLPVRAALFFVLPGRSLRSRPGRASNRSLLPFHSPTNLSQVSFPGCFAGLLGYIQTILCGNIGKRLVAFGGLSCLRRTAGDDGTEELKGSR